VRSTAAAVNILPAMCWMNVSKQPSLQPVITVVHVPLGSQLMLGAAE
jgi:hypothetical protein